MFEVVRIRRLGELYYQHLIVPQGFELPKDQKKKLSPGIYRFGPFSSEDEARDFIEELEKEN